ncbi:hypothetical protein QR680_019373 [Steinernema hermaphroditum]|uniref:Uncharacterized protein n=1 Tax=Steinernema hermaphroditum TaxID=289476 RepID=A0AA39GN85_9BILA|nr:hypothetical protein QR680_019373 [Steinernema hermaphroditum]
MSGATTPTGPTPKKLNVRTRHSSGQKYTVPNDSSHEDGTPFSSESLALKLDGYCKQLIASNKKIRENEPDLAGFDLKKDVESPSKFLKDRNEISKMAGRRQFDVTGRTALNYSDVSIAGAKLIIDENYATRSMTKELSKRTGADEDALLYPGIPEDHGDGSDLQSAYSIAMSRRSSLIESFVDFQKQMKFKRSVLKHVAEQHQELTQSHPRMTRRRTLEEMTHSDPKKRRITRTPKKQKAVNPLSDKKILDDYAEIVATEVTENSSVGVRGRVAPIPFNIDQ